MTVPTGVTKYVSIAFAVIYLGIGITVLWRSNELTNLPHGYAIPLGFIFIAYGLIRAYRAYKRYF